MAIPHRVGGALVVLGQSNGEQERDPTHVLSPPQYGPGNHEYFTSYPLTSPSNVVTKVAGTLGLFSTTPGVDYTPDTLPRNYLNIVCYKTTLNHWFPKIAWNRDGVYDAYNSDCINDPSSPYYGDEAAYQAAYSSALRSDIYASFVNDTTVTDILEDPTKTPANLRTLFPRWTTEAEWDMGVQPYEDAIQVPVSMGGLYYQTREAAETDVPVDFVAPWYVTFDTDDNQLKSMTRIFCDFSYKFTGVYDAANPVAWTLCYPYFNRDINWGLAYQSIPDTCSWQYGAGWPSDGYRTVVLTVFPENGSAQQEPMRWESEATQGLFLDANGSCWNLGTVLEVKVYIWKAPPKICFMPKVTGPFSQPSAYMNWKNGGYSGYGPRTTAEYDIQSQISSFLTGRGYGSPGNRHGAGDPGLQYFETGTPSGIPYSIPAPHPMGIMFWGVCFAPDYDSPLCLEHEVQTFTVTLDESNTFACDGTVRPGAPSPTAYGYKLADIVIPKVEGYMTYIQDYEVTEITKAGEA